MRNKPKGLVCIRDLYWKPDAFDGWDHEWSGFQLRNLGFLIYLSEEDGLNMTDCLQSSMTGRIGLKNMWMYTPLLANRLYFQDNYSNVLLWEWLKMTCQNRMDVWNCLKWLWLRWSCFLRWPYMILIYKPHEARYCPTNLSNIWWGIHVDGHFPTFWVVPK